MSLTFKQALYGFLIVVIVLGAAYTYYNYSAQKTQPAQQTKSYKVGMLIVDKDVRAGTMEIFKASMNKLGYVEGVNVEYIVREAVGEKANMLNQYAKELNEAGLDVVITGATSSTKPFKDLADLKTPVMSLSLGSLEGIIANPIAPEGFITGVKDGSLGYNSKRLSLLKESVSSIKKVISIIDRNHPNTGNFTKSIEKAAEQLGLTMVYIYIENFSDPKEIASKIPLVTKKVGDAYITCACTSGSRNRKELAEQLKKEKIPSITLELEQGADIGFLMSYGDDKRKPIELGAKKASQILKGILISKIPVEPSEDVVFELNAKTAETLGLTIPKSIISLANKIYNQ